MKDASILRRFFGFCVFCDPVGEGCSETASVQDNEVREFEDEFCQESRSVLRRSRSYSVSASVALRLTSRMTLSRRSTQRFVRGHSSWRPSTNTQVTVRLTCVTWRGNDMRKHFFTMTAQGKRTESEQNSWDYG